jgi:hypothetical protein
MPPSVPRLHTLHALCAKFVHILNSALVLCAMLEHILNSAFFTQHTPCAPTNTHSRHSAPIQHCCTLLHTTSRSARGSAPYSWTTHRGQRAPQIEPRFGSHSRMSAPPSFLALAVRGSRARAAGG